MVDVFRFPSRVVQNAYGKALIAEGDLEPGTTVARFEGPLVSHEQLPEEEICYALWISDDDWLIPQSTARYVNHSCDANCRVNDDLEVYTVRPVCHGEELTFSYNQVYPGEIPPAWDPRWSFPCQCGAAGCRGAVDGWVYVEKRG